MQRENYEDILYLPHYQSPKRQPMPLHDRAAQFAPFAALTGYDAAISETARLTDRRVEPDDETIQRLNCQIHLLSERIAEKPAAAVTYFIPDGRKEGGRYVTVYGRVRRVDSFDETLCLTDGRKIRMTDIIEIRLTGNGEKAEETQE